MLNESNHPIIRIESKLKFHTKWILFATINKYSVENGSFSVENESPSVENESPSVENKGSFVEIVADKQDHGSKLSNCLFQNRNGHLS